MKRNSKASSAAGGCATKIPSCLRSPEWDANLRILKELVIRKRERKREAEQASECRTIEDDLSRVGVIVSCVMVIKMCSRWS